MHQLYDGTTCRILKWTPNLTLRTNLGSEFRNTVFQPSFKRCRKRVCIYDCLASYSLAHGMVTNIINCSSRKARPHFIAIGCQGWNGKIKGNFLTKCMYVVQYYYGKQISDICWQIWLTCLITNILSVSVSSERNLHVFFFWPSADYSECK